MSKFAKHEVVDPHFRSMALGNAKLRPWPATAAGSKARSGSPTTRRCCPATSRPHPALERVWRRVGIARIHGSVDSGNRFPATPMRQVRAFCPHADGQRLQNGRLFHTVSPGYADGFRSDADGNVWSSAGDGVHRIDPSGQKLGKRITPCAISNLCFGEQQHSRLCLCAGTELLSVAVNCRGAQWP